VCVSDIRTNITVLAYKTWAETSKEERLQACYQHACLKYMSNEMLTNKSLRERFGVDEKNYPMVSRIIKEALKQGLIKVGTPEGANRRDVAYIPNWG
jgi:predicted HTH transcriptional regulator